MRSVKGLIRKNLPNLLFLFFVTICILFLIGAQNAVLLKVKAIGHSAFSVFDILLSGISSGVKGMLTSFDDVKRVKEELAKTREKLERLRDIEDEASELRKENIQLKGQLGFLYGIPSLYDGKTKRIPAMIIAKQPGNFSSSFTINKGAKDGVKPPMPVIARYSEFYGLVGKVTSSGIATSIVKPLFNSSFYAAARLEKSNYEGLVNGLGENDTHVIMQYVEKLAKSDVTYGELVITSGLGLEFPKGIHIGRVNSIISTPLQTSLDITIEPVIDFSRLEYVFIVDQGKSDGR
jgi:rod shape-determining protein MreC